MQRVGRFAFRRLLFLPVALLIIATLAFVLVNLLPGDPVRVIAGPASSPEQLADIRTRLGLDEPLGARYVAFMGSLVRLDLGNSFYTNRPVRDEIGRFLPNTVELVVLSLLVAAVLGLVLAVAGAYYAGRLPDRGTNVVVTVAQSMPDFVLALLLIYVFFFILGWAPAPVGRLGLLETAPEPLTGALLLDTVLRGEWGLLGSALRHSLLPVLALGFYYSAYFAKTLRPSLGNAMASAQVEFARACGLPERTVLYYGLRQACIPVLTYSGVLLAGLIGGAAIVELIFSWGGVGQWAIGAILGLDIPAIQGFIVVAGALTLLIFLMLDVLVAALDPRVQYK